MKSLHTSFALSLLASLYACGGGGGAGTPASSTDTATVPGAPQQISGVAGDQSVTLRFLPPLQDGGAPITGYLGTCSAGPTRISATASASPLSITGLSNGVSHTCTVRARNRQGDGAESAAVSLTPNKTSSGFSLASSAFSEGGPLPVEYTCDGAGSSPALSWTAPPERTQSLVLAMTTVPGDGSTKINWLLYDLPAELRALDKDSLLIGRAAVGSDGPWNGYQPPCSQGPGLKTYTFTLYALSGRPDLNGASVPVPAAQVLSVLAPLVIGTAQLNASVTRTQTTGSDAACLNVRASFGASTSGRASVSCDAEHAHVSSTGIAEHPMMNGILATNLQVPVAQNFLGANAWKIPLKPALAAATTSAIDGPVGIAVNGVPIFNPCKQGGCQNGDTKQLGELDLCNGHAGRADDYHYHAAPVCLMAEKPASYWDTHPLGWALDGFAIFGYRNADGSTAERDELCGGNTRPTQNAPQGYSYHVSDTPPYVLACFRGTPSVDFAGQAAKFKPLRTPPVTPFAVTDMRLSAQADGVQDLQFSTLKSFTSTATGSDQYVNPPGTYHIRYQPLSGAPLSALLAQPRHAGKSLCWRFQFSNQAGQATQPDMEYCR